jgi:hypothetical protein
VPARVIGWVKVVGVVGYGGSLTGFSVDAAAPGFPDDKIGSVLSFFSLEPLEEDDHWLLPFISSLVGGDSTLLTGGEVIREPDAPNGVGPVIRISDEFPAGFAGEDTAFALPVSVFFSFWDTGFP